VEVSKNYCKLDFMYRDGGEVKFFASIVATIMLEKEADGRISELEAMDKTKHKAAG